MPDDSMECVIEVRISPTKVRRIPARMTNRFQDVSDGSVWVQIEDMDFAHMVDCISPLAITR